MQRELDRNDASFGLAKNQNTYRHIQLASGNRLGEHAHGFTQYTPAKHVDTLPH